MKPAPSPKNETDRIRALQDYDILDSLPEEDFDSITKIASYICQTPISLVTLIDEDRQWFKSHHGLDITETPRDQAFCAHAILNPEETMVVPNALQDERFADNPLTIGDPHVVFYAGVPLVTPEGNALGTLCVIDNKPRVLNTEQLDALNALANQVVNLLELRRAVRELQVSKQNLETTYQHLEEFTQVVSHDIKAPLKNIEMAIEMLVSDHQDQLSKGGVDLLALTRQSASEAVHLTDSILRYSKAVHLIKTEISSFCLEELVQQIIQAMVRANNVRWEIPPQLPVIATSKIALKQILANLFNNAIKHNDKDSPLVRLEFAEQDTCYQFKVQDNGKGIPEDQIKRMFRIFETSNHLDRFHQRTTGIGLPIVRKLVEILGGTLQVQSTVKKGTTFTFTIAK